ncbi:MAG TPA: hypothetical protein VF758_06140 [Candidatus Acidoferrum sp.]
MTIFERLLYAPGGAAGLCSTCRWGTVRKGFGADEAEAFCRLIGPNARIRYAVRECTGYDDSRVEPVAGGARRYGFVTEIKLGTDEEVRVVPADESGDE